MAWSDAGDHTDASGSDDETKARNSGCRDRHGVVSDPEVWTDHFSEFMVTAYHQLLECYDSMGVPILDTCTFHAFVDFCFKHSSGHVPRV